MADIEELPSHPLEGKDENGRERYSPDESLAPERNDANFPDTVRSPVSKLVSDARTDAGAKQSSRVVPPDPNAPKLVNPLAEFDEYGTELRKDARVWKVYVEEADKYDKELVTGWKERAALFSAISTAFLIESSKKLQEDPADVSAQTLLVISQALLTLANGTRPPVVTTPPANSAVGFKPTNTAIWINTLWYLSLSLSLATAFIGILAKEWCHSFLTGRVGHPYEQSKRRQRKWDMIEHWKMPELLAVLPSLIHAALFLFAIGLCVYLWDMHIAVSIPVVCVSGIAFGFYMWSSVSACRVDYFPYPTIISRLYHTEWTQHLLVDLKARIQLSFSVLMRVLSLIFDRLVLPVVTYIIFPAFWILILVPFTPANILPLPILLLDIIPSLVIHFGPRPCATDFALSVYRAATAKELVCRLLRSFYAYFIWGPAFRLHARLEWIMKKLDLMLDYIYNTGPPIILEWIKGRFSRRRPRNLPKHSPNKISEDTQTDVTSQALSWLIKNCETPPSVDIALQSIAGANERISRKPLLECQATLQILRRLASSNLYREPGLRTNAIIALYSRALLFLSTPVDSNSSSKQPRTRSELEVLIWDLQAETEKTIAKLITDGRFEPTQSNLDALQIGNTAASNSLRILKQDSQEGDAGTNRILGSIVELLELQLSHRHPLHQAALLSLVHAAVLLALFAPKYTYGSTVPLLCPRIIYGSHRAEYEHELRSQLLINNLAIACILLCDQCADRDRLHQHNGLSWSEDALRGLIERHSLDQIELETISRFGRQELDARRESQSLESRNFKPLAHFATRSPSHFFGFNINSAIHGVASSTLQRLRALHRVYSLTPIGTLDLDDYLFVVGSMCHDRNPPEQSPSWIYGKELMSKCHFPTLYGRLSWLRGLDDTINQLQRVGLGDPVRRFLVAGQLWLLYTVYLDPSYDNAAQSANKMRSRTHRPRRISEPLSTLHAREPTNNSTSSVSFAEAPIFATLRLRSRSHSPARTIHIESLGTGTRSTSAVSSNRSPQLIVIERSSGSRSHSPVRIMQFESSSLRGSDSRSRAPHVVRARSTSSEFVRYRTRSESPTGTIPVDSVRQRSRSHSPVRIIQVESSPSRRPRSRSRSPHIIRTPSTRSEHISSRSSTESPTQVIRVGSIRSSSGPDSPGRVVQVGRGSFRRSRSRSRNTQMVQAHSESSVPEESARTTRSSSRSHSPAQIAYSRSRLSSRSTSSSGSPRIIWIHAPTLGAERLAKTLLSMHFKDSFQSGADCQSRLAEEIEQIWGQRDRTVATALGVWAYRLMECILQARNQPISKQIHKGLWNVPQELRGLCSFTDWRPQATETQTIEGEPVDSLETRGGIGAAALARDPNSDDSRTSNSTKDLDEAEAHDGEENDAGINGERIMDKMDESETMGEVPGNKGKEKEASGDENITMDETHKAESDELGEEDGPRDAASEGELLTSGECEAENTENDLGRGLTVTEGLSHGMTGSDHISIDMLGDEAK